MMTNEEALKKADIMFGFIRASGLIPLNGWAEWRPEYPIEERYAVGCRVGKCPVEWKGCGPTWEAAFENATKKHFADASSRAKGDS